MACFSGAGTLLFTAGVSGGGDGSTQAVIGASALLICGAGLNSIDLWQRVDEPSRE
jgi:hypothetical protein